MNHSPLVTCALFVLAPLAASQDALTKLDLLPTGKSYGSMPIGSGTYPMLPGDKQFCEFDGDWYFWAWTEATGSELFKTDGTKSGTQLSFDSVPGPASGGPHNPYESPWPSEFQVAGGKLFITGRTGALWVKTSSEETPYALSATAAGEPFITAYSLTAVGDEIYFMGTTPSAGMEIMVTDGTVAGTRVAYDAVPGPASSSFGYLYPGPKPHSVLFPSPGTALSSQLWITDGTPEGTMNLSGANPAEPIGGFQYPVTLGASVIFKAYTPSTGMEVFITDGTPAGTVLLADLNPGIAGSDPYLLNAGLFKGELYFGASIPLTGAELFKTDGTPGGTVFFGESWHGANGGGPTPIGSAGGRLYLIAWTGGPSGESSGAELFSTTGVDISLVKEIVPGKSGSYPQDGMALGDLFLFWGTTGELFSSSLFVSDGTAGGTLELGKVDFNDYFLSIHMTPVGGGRAIYQGVSEHAGLELMETDGTLMGTKLLADLNTDFDADSSNPSHLGTIDGSQLYLEAEVELKGQSIMRWTEAAGVEHVTTTDSMQAVRSDWVVHHEEITYESQAGGLRITDGTSSGTGPFGVFDSDWAKSATVLGSDGTHTFIAALLNGEGVELWITDGAFGTSPVPVILNPGLGSSSPREPVMMGGELYLIADVGPGIDGLVKSDGSLEGTESVVSPWPGGYSEMTNLMRVGDRLYFTANDGVHGFELWRSDGTTQGTVRVTDLRPGSASSNPVGLGSLGDELCFFALDMTSSKRHLWLTDDSAAGAKKISANLYSASAEGMVTFATSARFYFAPEFGPTAGELWSFDGQIAEVLMDLNPGSELASPDHLTSVGKQLFFTATTAATGREVFVTDGTSQGTHLAIEIRPGPLGSAPAELTSCDGDLFFVATDEYGDRELFHFDCSGADVIDLGMGASGARLSATLPVLGQALSISVEHAPAGTISLLGFSMAAGPVATHMMPGNASWIDEATFQLLSVSAGPDWTTTLNVPDQPALQGVRVNLQAWSLVGGSLPALTSNGLRLVLGD